MNSEAADKLYGLAWDRLEGRARGLGMPILWHLALRGYQPAMVELSQRLEQPGPIMRQSSSAGLSYRAYRRGSPTGAHNLAMDCFNRGDLGGYRRWLIKTANAGDKGASAELRRFETRLPHETAATVRRKRPYRRYEV